MIKDLLKPLIPMGQRNRLARARVWARFPTGPLRRLPDFLILGAMRAGTSSLYRYLGAHPRIAPSLRKETEFFSLWHHRGEAWYRSHFPLRGSERGGADPLQCFEATPYYLFHPHAPGRARRLLPDARSIVLLRDPVARAISHHAHLSRLGLEGLSFEEAIRREPERLEGEQERMLGDPTYRSRSHHLFSYRSRGVYAPQLERWFASYPRDRFLVLEFERLVRDPGPVLDEILRFLGLPPWRPAEFRNYSHVGGVSPRRDETGPPVRVRERLAEWFAPHNEELFRLLGRSFDRR